jgi:hypothetical protein
MKRKFTKRIAKPRKFYISPNFSETSYLESFGNEIIQYKKDGSKTISDYGLDTWKTTFGIFEVSEKIAKKNLRFNTFLAE